MSVYRRLARSKKGMSTIFGGLFFVILILMGFNVMLWGFVQFDAYNRVIANMSQRDQQAVSENIVPVNSTYTGGVFNIWVNNLGGSSVNIVQIYISNVNNTGNCMMLPCSSPGSFTFSRGNIPAGSVNYPIVVSGFTPASKTQYHITLASSRGRLFTLYYPWRFNSLTINNNGGNGQFVTNIGPLAVYFDFKSFNYTTGGQTTSQSAFCMPSTNAIFYIKIQNTAIDQNVTLLPQTAMKIELYGSNSPGLNVIAFIMDNRTINPLATFAYSMANPYVLQPSSINGVNQASFAIVKFGTSNEGTTGSVSFPSKTGNFLTFIGVYYSYRNQIQGETIPFMDFDDAQSSGNPNCIG